jgi:hypothetical protein
LADTTTKACVLSMSYVVEVFIVLYELLTIYPFYLPELQCQN